VGKGAGAHGDVWERCGSDYVRRGCKEIGSGQRMNSTKFGQEILFILLLTGCTSAKRTSWNEFSSSIASAVICLSTDEHVEDVNAGDADHGDDSVAHGEVPNVTEEPSIPSPTPLTPAPQPPQDIPSTSQRMIAEMDQDDAVVLKDDKEEDKEVVDKDVKEAKVDESAQDQGRQAESQVEIYKIDIDHANKVLSMQEDETKPTKVQEVVDVVTTTKLITEVVTAASETVTAASVIIPTAEPQVPAAAHTAAPKRIAAALSKRRKGVVIRNPESESTTSTIIPAETKSKDKGKRILDIDWDEAINHVKRRAKEDLAVKRYKVIKRKPQTEAQARKNMMMYLKNVAGFKMDYFKGVIYDDIRPVFEAKFNSNVAFFLKTKEQMEEEENRALQKLNETLVEREAKRRKLDEEVEELRIHLQIVPNEDDDVYTEATLLARKVPVVDYQRRLGGFMDFVKKKFSTTKPKNFSEDFLLVTLGAMFEKPDIHAQIWKTQRNEYGPAKVKGWKLLESCGVQIIMFTSTQLILLVERKYPLIRFTLDQMLNAVRLEVKEENEVSLDLLRFIKQQHQKGQHE
nr:hypothetical protein [Tanacetum cinerariifolium]